MARKQGERGRRPTLDDVAALANVGRGTASRVLNGSPQVSESTKEAVLAAVKSLSYMPNQAARSLVAGRTGAVALVISESEERIFNEPFFGAVVKGISEGLSQASRHLVLHLAPARTRTANILDFLGSNQVDGVLTMSLREGDDLPTAVAERGVPVVGGGRSSASLDGSWVDVDNRAGGRLAASHLIDRGRGVIASITGPRDMRSGRERLAGFVEVLEASSIRPDQSLIVEGDFTEGSGYRGMLALLDRRPDTVAVFAASDMMALGAIRAIRESERTVGGDIAVVGFDDSREAATAVPRLTTIRQPARDMGWCMASSIIRLIDEPGIPPIQIVLPVELVVRDTS
ncbi:hypothetical protein ASE12_14285 [Aeromicrobium sp. Root236]|uniref:LacI family DNA-binding transcriptional regulator n=1 Tax=Aeromicrobium sp. Root236 TaxID=1736498 RepID=UPI0006FFE86E|nr:LacI family DNA-binding transcriptional regulator [Aeromicrobium sp. Root236]KRC65822.1 hypothetical protein ASE12_14285 [Aeromicrobium sp. Root236]